MRLMPSWPSFWTRPNHLFDTMPYGQLIISIRVYVSNASKIIWIFARSRINSSKRFRRDCLWPLSKLLNWTCSPKLETFHYFPILVLWSLFLHVSSFLLENNNFIWIQPVFRNKLLSLHFLFYAKLQFFG